MNLGGVLVFVDHLHRQEALARIGQGDGHRTRIEIEHGRRIERIAVHPDDRLPGDRSRFAAMHEFAEAPILDHAAEIEAGLRADEIVGSDGERLAGVSAVRGARGEDERQQEGQGREERFHSVAKPMARPQPKSVGNSALPGELGHFGG